MRSDETNVERLVDLLKAVKHLSPTVAATVGFHDKVYCLCTICSIVDPPNVVKPHNSSYLMAGCYNLLKRFHSVKQTFYSCSRKRKVEKFGFVRRAI